MGKKGGAGEERRGKGEEKMGGEGEGYRQRTELYPLIIFFMTYDCIPTL